MRELFEASRGNDDCEPTDHGQTQLDISYAIANRGIKCSPIPSIEPKIMAPDQIKMICHDIAGPAREVEIHLDTMKMLSPRFQLILMVMASGNYRDNLNDTIRSSQNVSLIDPVPAESIPQMVNNFGLGVFFLQPWTFNGRAALPNKSFENMQSHVGSVSTSTSEMHHLMDVHHLGKVSRALNAVSFVEALESLDAEALFEFKLVEDKSAHALSLETYVLRIYHAIEKVL